jgi:hypothetical protein
MFLNFLKEAGHMLQLLYLSAFQGSHEPSVRLFAVICGGFVELDPYKLFKLFR